MSKATRTLKSAEESSVDELKSLLSDAEKALSAAGDDASEEITSLRDRLREALASGAPFARRALDAAKEQAKTADEFVHNKPYVAVGIAAGLGLIAGVLAASCRCHRS
ncbi:MAG: DUF883 family protein [Verrucomicrobiota bacterium]